MALTAPDVPGEADLSTVLGEADLSTVLGEADPSAGTAFLFTSEVTFFLLLASACFLNSIKDLFLASVSALFSSNVTSGGFLSPFLAFLGLGARAASCLFFLLLVW